MILPADDLYPRNDEPAKRELSIEELDDVAAGSILGDIWNFFKGEVNGKINEYKTGAGTLIDAGRDFIRLL